MLTAALALVALPGSAGSGVPTPADRPEPAAFQPSRSPRPTRERRSRSRALDPAVGSAGVVDAETTIFIEPGAGRRRRPERRAPSTSPAAAGSARKPPRYTINGDATFYDNGTTAMRLPRGTT